MKKNILFLFLFPLLLCSCFSDDTTEATRELSEITIIEGSVREVYNVYKNTQLTITPEVTQSVKPLPLSYEWEVGDEVVSTDPVLVYPSKELGSFQCRLIVENEDGRTFFPFKINVNTAYEEGLTIVSREPDGKSHLAFMLTPTDDSPMKFYDYECFSANNEDIDFASNVIDVAHTKGSLAIACQGSGGGKDIPTVYYLNDKTFVVENVLSAPEFPDFVPSKVVIPQVSGKVAYPILCENGKVYDVSPKEGAIAQPARLRATYANSVVSVGESPYMFLFWDEEVDGLAQLYNSSGPYYCSDTIYHLSRNDKNFDEQNYFKGKSFLAMTEVRQTDEQLSAGRPEALIFSLSGSTCWKVRLAAVFHTIDEDGDYVLLSNGGLSPCGAKANFPFDENTPVIANKTYNSLFYADGNKVRRWYFTSSKKLNKNTDEVLLTVGSDNANAVITGFEISADHKKTYVAFYEPGQTGKNGSVWVFNTDTGEVIESEKYDNVCYRPMKMIYKRK